MSQNNEKPVEGLQTALLTLEILDHLAIEGREVGVTALARALGTTKSRIYRHLQTLVQRGYAVQSSDTERYRVGPRLVSLGRAVCQNFDIAKVAEDTLHELRDRLGHYSVVSQVESDGVRVLATISGKSDVEIGVKQGSLLAFHASAQGKVALAYGSDTLRAKVLRSPLKPLTPHTIINPAALRKEIDLVRKQGWAVAPNETVIGMNALAAPVFDASGSLVLTITITDSIQFLRDQPSKDQIRETVAAAKRLSALLGYVTD
jgi:DNA-binding IclR family transcriptional regulator